jgi:hypothetical protein
MYEPLFGGPLGDWLAVFGVVGLLYAAWRLLAALIRFAQSSPTEDEAPVPVRAGAARAADPFADPFLADLPVIAAAVAAMLDSHRIVHIEEVPHGQVWSAQGRWLHQTSHQTH